MNSFLGRIKLSALSFPLLAITVYARSLSLKMNSFSSRIKLLGLIFSLLAFTACTRLPNIQGRGESFFQGVWNQDSIANSSQLLNYTKHHFKITCDSFYVELTTFSKVNYYADSCFNKGIWKEYAKGTYVVSGDTLQLSGTFTKANYKQKVTGCYRSGRYISSFKIEDSTSNNLRLESFNDQREIKLVLKEKITCMPKEL